MDDIKKDIKSIEQTLISIDKTLIIQEKNLEQHMYRTELAEKRLEHIENGLNPIKAHVKGMGVFLKLVGFIGLIVSILKGTGVI